MTRLTADHRRRLILEAGIELALDGLYEFGIEAVADKAKCSHPLIIYYFGSAIKLREAVINHAIETDNAKVLAQAIVKRDPLVDCLNARQRKGILLTMAG